ncbi:MAG: succinate-semialdehyde dehydrogenase [Candidatus Atribacteria bacterium]|nr:succinate-semialdehyde dehydrogenase [Candidatus Atribacteria bacterium]
MEAKEYIGNLVQKAKVAQRAFENATQEEVDVLVKALGKIVYDNAEDLARRAVEESGMGVYEDKVKKNRAKANIIWNSLRSKKSVGIISRDEEPGIVKIAKPAGIVAAITPVTNPIVTPMCNSMFAIKGRNAVIVSPHPRTKKCGAYLISLFRNALTQHGAPEDLIQIIEEPTSELTVELMKAVDVVVSTGGGGIVKLAYSSGKPSLGVGQGNVQCIIDRGIDVKEAVSKIIQSRAFDNGIICSCEQSVIIPQEMYEAVIDEFKAQGTYYVEDEEEKNKFAQGLFPGGIINKDLIGQSVQKIAQIVGVNIPQDRRVIVIKENNENKKSVFRKEKMFPVLAAFTYGEFDEAINIAEENLEIEGIGHTVSVHSNNKQNIEKLGERVKVSRVVVNAPCATTAGGSFNYGFAPTTTLGCGYWGNNSLSENLDYKHLLNITRIGYPIEGVRIPTEEELWG